MSKEQAIEQMIQEAQATWYANDACNVWRPMATSLYSIATNSILDYLEKRAEGVGHICGRYGYNMPTAGLDTFVATRVVCSAACPRCALDKVYEKLKEMIG